MYEYPHIEKPFLTQLANLGWEVIVQNPGIPTAPQKSRRTSFREVVLREVFKSSVRNINLTEEGVPWLTDQQLDEVYEEVTEHPRKNLHEANKLVWRYITGKEKIVVEKNEVTGEESPTIKVFDFDSEEPLVNSFIAINQFRIDTPGAGKGFIIPDIVLFINGLPVVVIECKDHTVHCSDPINEAVEQILRYSNQREGTRQDGLKEGEESLFWFNQFNIATYGDMAKYGTISATEEYYFEWKDIYPEKYKDYKKPLNKERSQEILIQGMLPPATLLDLIRHFILYKPEGDKEIKIVSRYQQYRAVLKIIDRLLKGETPLERSGVVWHTQGSGKSLTMVMLVKKVRSVPALKDYKILMVNDRTDLEEQLGETANLTDETIDYVTSIKTLRDKLSTPTSNVVMVMVHKFQEQRKREKTETDKEINLVMESVPEYNLFGKVNESDKILILVDEAHRTQSSDLGDSLFDAFPYSTKIAFTGTPLITERHKKKTHERFGSYIDKYKLKDAVDDGATLQILYEGKTSDNAINEKAKFEDKFENLVKKHTAAEIEAIKKKYGTYGDVLEAESRINTIAKDIVKHYVNNILPNGFKAQVVASSVLAAVRYKKAIQAALDNLLNQKEQELIPDTELIEQLRFIKVEAVVSSQGTNEAAIITEARKASITNKAVDNFKEKFNYEKPLTGIAFLVVCDMLLTGFDAPIEQILYVDKKMKEHNLLQAIARVNRTTKGKSRGYVVDYIGNTTNLKDALKIYSKEEVNDILSSYKDIDSEIPILEQRYNRLIQLFNEQGITRISEWVNQKISNPNEVLEILEECVEKAKDVKFRAEFEVFFKRFVESMDIVLPNKAANPYKIPSKRFAYILFRIKQRYKDNSINIEGIGKKVKSLINEHLISLGINPKIPPTELFSDSFEDELNKNSTPKAIASEMEHAIRKHIKINIDDDPTLYRKMYEKLEAILKQFENDWKQQVKGLKSLKDELESGRVNQEEGISLIEAPFFDLIIELAFGNSIVEKLKRDKCKAITSEILLNLRSTIGIIGFWNKGHEINRLRGDIADILLFSNIDELITHSEKIVTEIIALAKRRHKQILENGEDGQADRI